MCWSPSMAMCVPKVFLAASVSERQSGWGFPHSSFMVRAPGMSAMEQQFHLSLAHWWSMRQQKDFSGASSPPVVTRPPAQQSRAAWNSSTSASPEAFGPRAAARSSIICEAEINQAKGGVCDGGMKIDPVPGVVHHVKEDGANERPQCGA